MEPEVDVPFQFSFHAYANWHVDPPNEMHYEPNIYVHREEAFQSNQFTIAISEVSLMEALPAFQTGVLPKAFPHLACVSSSVTVALLQEADIYRSYELERCHCSKFVAECTPVQRVEVVRYELGEVLRAQGSNGELFST